MKITINPSYQWDDNLGKYVLISHDGVYEHTGPIMSFGGGQKAADPAEQAQASAGANAAAQASANLSNQYAGEQKQQYQNLFGANGTGGNLTKMMDPSSLNVSSPTGPYALQYKQATGNLAQQTSAQRGQLSATLANQGFGSNSPSGMGQDAALQLSLGQNAQQGQLFTQAATNSYNDALNNFWNANNIAAGQAATSQAGALQGQSTAAQTNTNLYNTSSQPYTQQGLGSALLGAGAQAGSAVMCPVKGSLILMADGTWKAVEKLKAGDQTRAIDGSADTVEADPVIAIQKVVLVHTKDTSVKVSTSHYFDRVGCGCTRADQSLGQFINTSDGKQQITGVIAVEPQEVCYFLTLPSNSYNVDGFWSMS